MSAAESADWYLERGRVVFTAAYHLRRGSCCGSGCRHCPYGGGAASVGESVGREEWGKVAPGPPAPDADGAPPANGEPSASAAGAAPPKAPNRTF
ncbi:hypothetical protein Pla175_04240 [Pirellulimonas nuda]|uniref:Uncharacterized protein n=1 Tax=Pirellulimonas nuda TaxID=2528009 RepID=A0A518D6K0_9BACT|nr:hypothetical protein Pla175_04240 [Pirellulimonas nuda]